MDFKEQEAHCSLYGQQAHVDKDAKNPKRAERKAVQSWSWWVITNEVSMKLQLHTAEKAPAIAKKWNSASNLSVLS